MTDWKLFLKTKSNLIHLVLLYKAPDVFSFEGNDYKLIKINVEKQFAVYDIIVIGEK